MKTIKKVAVSPLPRNEASVIDSLNSGDDQTINAPSIHAVNTALGGKSNSDHNHDSRYKLQGDFAVISGSSVCQISEGATYLSFTEDINYPTGFTVDNTVIISIGIKNAGQQLFSYSFGTLSDTSSTGYVSSSFGKSVILNSDNIQLKCYYNFGASHTATNITYNYKIVLMKVS